MERTHVTYGAYYYCIKTSPEVAGHIGDREDEGIKHGYIHVLADDIDVRDGTLVILGRSRKITMGGPKGYQEEITDATPRVFMAFAPGQWEAAYAESGIDSLPVSIPRQ